jgi:hypothetical protein
MQTAMETATDKNGEALAVGSVCIYVPTPNKRDPDRDTYVGRRVIVRAVRESDANSRTRGKLIARIDDDVLNDDAADKWHWSAWVTPDELVKV